MRIIKFMNWLFLKNRWALAAVALCLLLVVLEILFIANEPWAGDYWEHKSVLKELSLHPFHPSHPIIHAQLPHAFFSPYLILQGFIAHYFILSITHVMNGSVLINLFLFFAAIYLLVLLFLKSLPDKWKSFTLLLLLILFFHGIHPSNFSSFFHFDAFPFLLSYPSTFSFICSIFSGCLFFLLINKKHSLLKNILLYLSTVTVLWAVLLTHPLTYLFAASLFLYVFFTKYQLPSLFKTKQFLLDGFAAACLISLPFAIAVWWGYYPFYSLITYINPGNQFHTDSRELYSSLLFKLYPFVTFLLLLKKNLLTVLWQEFPLLLAVFFLVAFFIYGFVSESFGFGRVLSFITIFSNIFLLKYILLHFSSGKQILIFCTMLILCSPFIYSTLKQKADLLSTSHKEYISRTTYANKPTSEAEMAHRAQFLKNYLKQGDIVLATKGINFFIPTTGARVIASHYPAYWITDNLERLNNIQLFFSSITDAERKQILEKYKVSYIVLTPETQSILPQIQLFTDSTFKVSQNGIILLKVLKVFP